MIVLGEQQRDSTIHKHEVILTYLPPTPTWHPFLSESSVKARRVVKMLLMLKHYRDQHVWVVFSLRVSADVTSWNVQVRPDSLV